MGKMVVGHTNGAPPYGLLNCKVFAQFTTGNCQWWWWPCVISQQKLDEGQLWYTAHYYLCLFAWCKGIQNWIPSDDGVVETAPRPYLAMAYARRLQVVACQSLGLHTNTLAHLMEAFLKAMSGAFALPSDGILHFLESDAHTEPLEMQGPLKDMFPAFWDLFGTPDEDPLAGILVMHKVRTEYKMTIHLHNLSVGMMSRKGQMGELKLGVIWGSDHMLCQRSIGVCRNQDLGPHHG